jgi:multiple sugar transport system ATP-binding protein
VFGQFRVGLDPARRPRPSGRVVLGIRPEYFEDAAFAPVELPTIDVEVVVQEDLGADAHVFFRIEAERVATEVTEGEAAGAPDLVTQRGALLNARVDPRTSARVGMRLRLAVDPARFHFFDAKSGSSLLESLREPAMVLTTPTSGLRWPE